MQRTVTPIPATIQKFTKSSLSAQKKRKVAGYARVSTDHDEQFTSYQAQVDYYTSYIKSHNDWEFIEVFTDEGITGTVTSKRDGFNRMISEAMKGNIDLIVTKSVSRFARNTVDSLSTIRKLKENNVEVFFEKENIWTFDSKGELLITIMSSLAQEESRSISENVTWGIRKKFSDGRYTLPYSRFLGYDKGQDGSLVVNRKQAETVKRIYGMYLAGNSACEIARTLTEEEIPTPAGFKIWRAETVLSILKNEKYKGDALLQKYYTVNFMGGIMAENDGCLPQYYVENDHEAIIDKQTFEEVQSEIVRRGRKTVKQDSDRLFAGRIHCGQCGSLFGPKIWHSNSKYRAITWQCNDKYGKEHRKCTSGNLKEEQLKKIVVDALNHLYINKEYLIASFTEIKAVAFDTKAFEDELEDHRTKMLGYAKQMNDAMERNKRQLQDQEEYNRNYNKLNNKFLTEKRIVEEYEAKIKDKQLRCRKAEVFMEQMAELQEPVETFSTFLWFSLCDGITIYSSSDIRVKFKDGTEYESNPDIS